MATRRRGDCTNADSVVFECVRQWGTRRQVARPNLMQTGIISKVPHITQFIVRNANEAHYPLGSL